MVSAFRATPGWSCPTSGRAALRKRPACSRATSSSPWTEQPAENLPSVTYNFRLRDSTEKVKLVVLRGTTEHTFSVTPVEQTSEFDSMAALADPEKNLVAELGILGIEIDPRAVPAGSGLREPYGIVVAARAAGARSEVPLAPSDVIRSINGTKTFTLYQLRTALQALKRGAPVTLQVQREGRLLYVAFTYE